MKGPTRTADRLRAHYDVEKELAARLRTSSAQERRSLYSTVYNTLFRRVPDHPQLIRKDDKVGQRNEVNRQLRLLRRYVDADQIFLEVGSGDCSLAAAVAPYVHSVIAVDVSADIAVGAELPENVQFIVSDGVSIPAADGTVDLVYSNQLMEHLHPEDAVLQLENIHRALRLGGAYLCLTPNRVSGPHDISKYFDESATGFHLREYSSGELHSLFRRAGFNRIRSLIGAKGFYLDCPVSIATALERVCELIPRRALRYIPGWFIIRPLLGVQMRAVKTTTDPACA